MFHKLVALAVIGGLGAAAFGSARPPSSAMLFSPCPIQQQVFPRWHERKA